MLLIVKELWASTVKSTEGPEDADAQDHKEAPASPGLGASPEQLLDWIEDLAEAMDLKTDSRFP